MTGHFSMTKGDWWRDFQWAQDKNRSGNGKIQQEKCLGKLIEMKN